MYRILIVEDEPLIADAIAEKAAQWGMEPRIAENLRDITGEFHRFRPHIVVLDIILPFFNGYHWCSEIRKESTVPILFISSAADNMNIVMAMDMGGDDFIAKPFDSAVLMAKLRSLLRRSYDYTAVGGLHPGRAHHGQCVLSHRQRQRGMNYRLQSA